MKRQTRGFVIVLGVIVLHAQNVFGQYLPPSQVDFYSTPPAGVGDVVSALGLQVDGKVSGLFAGESLMATLGPTGGGRTTLLGSRGFVAGDKVRITNVGGGILKIDRLAPDGCVKTYIHTQVQDYYRPDGLEEMAMALGMQLVGKATGLFAGPHNPYQVPEAGLGLQTQRLTRQLHARVGPQLVGLSVAFSASSPH